MLVTHTAGQVGAPAATCGQGPQRAPAPRPAGVVLELSGAGAIRRCGTRARARTVPFSSAATAFTAVVPMSMPTVTEPDTAVMIGHYE